MSRFDQKEDLVTPLPLAVGQASSFAPPLHNKSPRVRRTDSVMDMMISPRDQNPGNKALSETLAIVYDSNGQMYDTNVAKEKYSRLFSGYYIRGFAEKILFNCHYDMQGVDDPTNRENHLIGWIKTYLSVMFTSFFGENPREPTLPAWILQLTPFRENYFAFFPAKTQRIIAEIFEGYVYAISEQITEISHEEVSDINRRRLNGFNYFLSYSFGIQYGNNSTLNTKALVLQRAFHWHTKYYERSRPAQNAPAAEHEADRLARRDDATQLKQMFGWFEPHDKARKKPDPLKEETQPSSDHIFVPIEEKDFPEIYTDWESSQSFHVRFIENPHVLADDARSIISIIKDEIQRLRADRNTAAAAEEIENILKEALKIYFSRIKDELEYSRLLLLHILPTLFQYNQTAYFKVLEFAMTRDLRFGYDATFYRIGTPYSRLAPNHRSLKIYNNPTEIARLDEQLAQRLVEDYSTSLQRKDLPGADKIFHYCCQAEERLALLLQLQVANNKYLSRIATGCQTHAEYQQKHKGFFQREHKNVKTAFDIKGIIEAALLRGKTKVERDVALYRVHKLVMQAPSYDSTGWLNRLTGGKKGGSELHRELTQVMPHIPEFVQDDDRVYQCDIGNENDHPLHKDIQYLKQKYESLADGTHHRLKVLLRLALSRATASLRSDGRDIAAAETEVLWVVEHLMTVSKDPRTKAIANGIEQKRERLAQDHSLYEGIQYLRQKCQTLRDGNEKLKVPFLSQLHRAVSLLPSYSRDRDIAAAEKIILSVTEKFIAIFPVDDQLPSIEKQLVQDHPLYKNIQYLRQKCQTLKDGNETSKVPLLSQLCRAVSLLLVYSRDRNIAAAEQIISSVTTQLISILPPDDQHESIKNGVDPNRRGQASEAQGPTHDPFRSLSLAAGLPPVRTFVGELNKEAWVQGWKSQHADEYKEDAKGDAAANDAFAQALSEYDAQLIRIRQLPVQLPPLATSLVTAFEELHQQGGHPQMPVTNALPQTSPRTPPSPLSTPEHTVLRGDVSASVEAGVEADADAEEVAAVSPS